MKTKVNASNMSKLVEDAFTDCLFKENEDLIDCVKVEGITDVFEFNLQRLQEKRYLLKEILSILPYEFKFGWTFLNLSITNEGEQWTDERSVCEKLLVMAIGLDLMKYCVHREMWSSFPGGLPYVAIK